METLFAALFALLLGVSASSSGQVSADTQGQSFHDSVLHQQRELGEKFRAGDTNAPLLVMEWFMNDHYMQLSSVSRSGFAAMGDYGEGGWGSGRGGSQLDSAQLQLLTETINKLPPP